MGFWLFLAICYIVYVHVQKAKSEKAAADKEAALNQQLDESGKLVAGLRGLIVKQAAIISSAETRIKTLEPFQECADAAQEAKRILQSAHDSQTESDRMAKEYYDNFVRQAHEIRDDANRTAKERRAKIEQLIKDANEQASMIINRAKEGAEHIAGDAYRALKDVDALKATSEATSTSSPTKALSVRMCSRSA